MDHRHQKPPHDIEFRINDSETIGSKKSLDPSENHIFSATEADRKKTTPSQQCPTIESPSGQEFELNRVTASTRPSVWQLLSLIRPDIIYNEDVNLSRWLIQSGFSELNLASQDAALIKLLNKSKRESNITEFKQTIWDIRDDVREKFKTIQSPSFQAWLKVHGKKEYKLPTVTDRGRLSVHLPKQISYQERPFGVNLIGYSSSVLGIGEDLRTCREALESIGIPTASIDIPTKHTSNELRERARTEFDQMAPYAFNLICMTAEEHARIFLELGYAIFTERYNIGYWPWELDNWPEPWKPLFGLVDEVWASSRHTYRSIQKELNHRNQPRLSYCPLGISPIAPLTSEQKAKARNQNGLPSETLLSICSFDGRSSFHRKNPWGTINAFLEAFPKNDRADVGLVIKTIHADVDPNEWKKLKTLIEQDERIHLLDAALDREELIQLYGCCDVLISLHRAEGFGRILAECLLLGLDVVATNYSGNTDFCKGMHAHPVDYEITPVPNRAYPYYQNQTWAEPNHSHAAEILRKIYAKKLAQQYGQTRKNCTEISGYQKNLFTDSIAKYYGNQLKAIWNQSRNKTADQLNLRWSRKQCLYGMEEN